LSSKGRLRGHSRRQGRNRIEELLLLMMISFLHLFKAKGKVAVEFKKKASGAFKKTKKKQNRRTTSADDD
jgi:hypothetical protein